MILFKPKYEAFKKYYPTLNDLDKKQIKYYKYVVTQTEKLQKLNTEDHLSYLYLYSNECVAKINQTGIRSAIEKLNRLKLLYPSIDISFIIGDLKLIAGDINEAFNTYELNPSKIQTDKANHVLNMKYTYKQDVKARELLCLIKKLTSFGIKHVDKIEEKYDQYLNQIKENKNQDYLQYIGNKYFLERKYSSRFLLGLPLEVKKHINHKPNKRFCFWGIEELLIFIKEKSRHFENEVRKDMEIPKIGEGWVSETELYYKLKSYFEKDILEQHASPSWLGRQHLDIYFPDYKIAVEYQGKQHYKPVEFFGGEEAFKKNKRRDINKKSKCTKNGVKLITVKKGYKIEKLIAQIEEIKSADNN